MNKYNAKKDFRIHKGEKLVFDSKLEAKRFDYLYLMLRAKKIKNLTLQVPFVLVEGFVCQGKKIRPITYTVDFAYDRFDRSANGWQRYVDDAKGVLTDETKLRQKLFLKEFGDKFGTMNSKLENKVWIEKSF